MHTDPECYLPKETEVHVMAPDYAAPCDVDFLLVVRLPSDAVTGTACITETVVYTVLTFDVFSCMRAFTVRQSLVHQFYGVVLRGGCSRGSLQIC